MKVYIDNQLVLYPNQSILEPKFTLRRKNEDGRQSISFTGEITFTGTDYDYIYQKLVLDPQAINNSVELTFEDDCCGNKKYYFLIKPESLKWCEGSCEITANAVEYTPESRAYNCVESTLIWDDFNGFKSKPNYPRVTYCLEYRPSILQDLLIIVGLFVAFGANALIFTLVTTLGPLILTINAIISAINALGGSLNPISFGGTTGFLGMIQYVYNIMTTTNGHLITGCGYEHPSPFVRDYIDNVCLKCGLSFSSSILAETNSNKPNRDYLYLMYFNAPVKSGRINIPFFNKPLVNYIEDNQPIHNLKTFLDEVKQPFNAEWDIVNNVVRFERRDFFQSNTPWFDVTAYNKEKVISECYEWSRKQRPAYGDFQYSKDAIDWVGNEAFSRYSSIAQWNIPVNPIQKGPLTKLFPYTPSRHRDDGIERDVLTDYESGFPFISPIIQKYKKSMIMNSGISALPKLLIWDEVSPLNNAWVVDYNKGGVSHAYNYPMWVDPNYPGNLYDRFWAIENPKNTTFSGFDFEIQVIWDCNLLNSINLNSPIVTTKGTSKTIDSIDLDFSTSTMTIKGTI